MTERLLLNHEATGNDRKLGLLLLHPLGGSLRFWDTCVEIWRDHLSCVAVDLRNITEGPAGAGPVSIEQHVADLQALRAHLGFERLIPVGCAISTMIAAGYAAHDAEHVAALVLSNATARSSPQAGAMLAQRGKLVREQGIAAILPQAVERAFQNLPHDERYRQYLAAFAGQSADEYAFACEACARYDAEAYLRQIRCPALVVAGQHDILLPPTLASEVAHMIPGALLHVMQEAAHFAPYQAAAAFADLVLAFVDGLTV